MGTTDVHASEDAEQRRAFMKALLADVRALEHLIEHDLIESGVGRVGAEQELFLVDRDFRPAPLAEQVLSRLDDLHVTTELAQYNLEFNLDPLSFGGDCLGRMERQILDLLGDVRRAARECGADVAMVGILPSIAKEDVGLHNITDRPRYHALNQALLRLRQNKPYELHIKGLDELIVHHDNVMLESCNTSFQVHFQVDADSFARKYNIAQAVAAPVLAAAVNSPMLFGKRLWRESRIALFQQAIDTRATREGTREFQSRVSFGTKWIEHSILEVFQEDIARFKTLFSNVDSPDPMAAIERGEAPPLSALCLHNGTVWRWTRPCYGISDNGRPHLRIENRVLPSGPTPRDEIANAAFWFGLMKAVWIEYGDITRVMSFDAAHENFVAAARHGLDAQLSWVDREPMPAKKLIEELLLPLARDGLVQSGIDPEDVRLYLDVIEGRCRTGQTGAVWMLNSLGSLGDSSSRTGRMATLTRCMVEHERDLNRPVHEWPLATPPEERRERAHFRTIGQFMTTDLFTVQESDVIDLAASLMDWKHIRHIPVEDEKHRLVGLVSHRHLMRYLARHPGQAAESVAVSKIMVPDPMTVTPETSTIVAMRLMRERRIGCLPVIEDGRLVGIVTEHDFVTIAEPLLEKFLHG